jgi:hypothetical protein
VRDAKTGLDDVARRRAMLAALALAALATGVVALDLWWIARDSAPMPHPYDPYAFLARALRFPEAPGWAGVAALSLQGRPPLYQLLSLPLLAVFGRSLDAALLLNVAFKLVLLGCTYGIGRLLGGVRAGLLAALLVAAYPPVVYLGHVYRPHAVLPACVAASTLLLLLLLRRPSPQLAWASGLSLAFGLLIHPTFALVLGLPSLAAGVFLALFRAPPRWPPAPTRSGAWLLAKLRHPLVTRGLLPAALIALLPALLWYLSYGATLVDAHQLVASRARPLQLGFPRLSSELFWYVLSAPAALSNVLTALVVLGVLQCLWRPSPPRLLLVFALGAGLLSLNLHATRAWWYGAELLPLAAAISAVGVVELRPAALARAGAALCAIVAIFLLAFVHLGDAPWSRPVARALGSRVGKASCATLRNALFCPGPPRSDTWPFTAMMAAAAAHDASCGSARPCVVFLAGKMQYRPYGDGWPTLSSALFDFHAALGAPQHAFAFRVPVRDHCGMDGMLGSDYVVWFEPDGAERIGCFGAWSEFLAAPPPALGYETLARFELPGGRHARLSARTAPATPQEREAVAEALRKVLPRRNRGG